jgi:hypothetical protein
VLLRAPAVGGARVRRALMRFVRARRAFVARHFRRGLRVPRVRFSAPRQRTEGTIMISRLTAAAAVFAILATAGLGFAAEAQQRPAAPRTAAAKADAMPTITLPRVEITGHRLSAV